MLLLLLLRKYTSYPLGPLRIVAAGAKTGALGAWDLILVNPVEQGGRPHSPRLVDLLFLSAMPFRLVRAKAYDRFWMLSDSTTPHLDLEHDPEQWTLGGTGGKDVWTCVMSLRNSWTDDRCKALKQQHPEVQVP